MTVESFDPSKMQDQTGDETIAALIDVVESAVNLSAEQIERFAPLATTSEWVGGLTDENDGHDERLVALIRLFTLGEMQHDAWSAGAKSPVVALARALKKRGTYPAELTTWIKANSTNRFLPHGSLMDRL